MAGDPQAFLDHLTYLFPADLERRLLLDVLAFIVQHPGKLLGYMTLIQGWPGTGKSYLGHVLRSILGHRNVRVIRTDELKNQWSDWMANVALVIIEELLAPGRMEMANSLKAKITEPVVRIEKKHVPSYEIENTAKFLAFTNHDVATYVSPDDRRTLVLKSQAVARNEEYYRQLFTWSHENMGVIYRMLLDHDLSSFNPHGHAPMTDAKRELIEDSRPPLEAEIKSLMDAERSPLHRDVVRAEEIKNAFSFRWSEFAGVTERKIGLALRSLGAVKLEQFRLKDGTKPRLWVVRNVKRWAVNSGGKWEARDRTAVEAELLRSPQFLQV